MAQTIICPKHGGPWGTDETCVACTMSDGTAMPLPEEDEEEQPTKLELVIWLKDEEQVEDFQFLTEIGEFIRNRWGKDTIDYVIGEG